MPDLPKPVTVDGVTMYEAADGTQWDTMSEAVIYEEEEGLRGFEVALSSPRYGSREWWWGRMEREADKL